MTDLELVSIIREAGRRWRELQAQNQAPIEEGEASDPPPPAAEVSPDEQKRKGSLPHQRKQQSRRKPL